MMTLIHLITIPDIITIEIFMFYVPGTAIVVSELAAGEGAACRRPRTNVRFLAPTGVTTVAVDTVDDS